MSNAQQKPGPKRSVEVEYRVLRPFKYNGQELKPGDEFIPAGAPNDGKLIEQGKFVKRIETVVDEAEKARRQPKQQRQATAAA